MNVFLNAKHIDVASLFNLAGPELIIIGLITGFPIWMIVDCMVYETDAGNKKAKWLLMILLVPFGSIFYCLMRRGFNRAQLEVTDTHASNHVGLGTALAVAAVIGWMILIVSMDLGIV